MLHELVLLCGVAHSHRARESDTMLGDASLDHAGRQDDRFATVALDLLKVAISLGPVAASLS
jgi:hypothetical protein